MDQSTLAPDEVLSAFVDGYLGPDQSAEVVQRLVGDPDGRDTWHTYHVIGDVLRDRSLAPTAKELEFAQRLHEKIAAQSPLMPLGRAQEAQSAEVAHGHRLQSANQDRFNWKMVAGLAALGLGVLMAFGVRENGQILQSERMAAQDAVTNPGTSVAVASGEEGVMLRNPELDALLTAHQQMGGHSALQMPSGFLRNATFDRSGR